MSITENRYFLAFDTAMNGCNVALFDAHTDRCEATSVEMVRGQAEQLVPMVQDIMQKAGVRFADVAAIGVTVGPGAFTGVRISLAAARALGVALNVPVVGLTTLEILAHYYCMEKADFNSDDENLAVLIETKRRDYYMQVFDRKMDSIVEACAAPLDEVIEKLSDMPCVVIGDAAARFKEEVAENCPSALRFDFDVKMPDAQIMAERCCALFNHAKTLQTELPKAEPVYLRGADVSKSKKKKRKLAEPL